MQDIPNLLDEIIEKQKELSITRREKNETYNLYRRLSEKEEQLEEELQSLKDISIPIKLSELIEELSKLTKTNLQDINIALYFDSWYQDTANLNTKKEILEIIGPGIYFKISDIHHHFSYKGVTHFHTREEMLSLFKHSSFKFHNINNNYIIPLDKNISDIILNIDITSLLKQESEKWYPENLFKEAIINCLNKRKNVTKTKMLVPPKERNI